MQIVKKGLKKDTAGSMATRPARVLFTFHIQDYTSEYYGVVSSGIASGEEAKDLFGPPEAQHSQEGGAEEAGSENKARQESESSTVWSR